MKMLRLLLLDRRAASAAEFALVLPLLLLFLFGIIDAGRFMWEYNRAEKATQMGVRFAVATDLVPAGLVNYSFAVQDSIVAGQPVPTANFSSVTCDENACSPCVGGNVCSAIGYNGGAFDAIVNRMADFYPAITPADVTIQYRNVGLGYAGDPASPDVAPLVTVSLRNMEFQPITSFLFATLTMPDFRAALTAEDLDGSQSN